MKHIMIRTAVTSAILCLTLQAIQAQQTGAETKPTATQPEVRSDGDQFGHVDPRKYKTFYLKNDSATSDADETQTAIRLLCDPQVKLFLDSRQKTISVRGTDHDLALIQGILDDLDKPQKVYLITYTVKELEGGKIVGNQHFAMTAASGSRVTLKQGSKVPIVTGTYAPGKSDQSSQVTYLDIGLNFDSTPESLANGVSLKSSIEQSGVVPEASATASDPIIRQSVLESVSTIPLGKPTLLGSVDVPGSTRHLEFEVQVDLVR